MRTQENGEENFTVILQKGVRFINVQGPPVPIPNTEVKLHRADNT